MLYFPTTIKGIVFNERVIDSNWNAMNRGPVAKAGNLVRKIAVMSIKLRKDRGTHSPPGTPPYSHDVGYKVPRFRMIYSIPDRMGTRAVVGMQGLGANPTAPNLQEYGGTAFREFLIINKIRRRNKRGQFRKSGKIIKKYSGIVNIPPRPFMRPALAKAVASGQLPWFWANSLGTKAKVA